MMATQGRGRSRGEWKSAAFVKMSNPHLRDFWSAGAEEIAEAMKPRPRPSPVRTQADMSDEEVAELERLYGAVVLFRRGR